MSHRFLFVSAALVAVALSAVAQSPKNYTPPKLPWGDPDLQGEWPAFANIPMQRPASFGTRAYLTDEEFAQRAKQAQKQSESDSEEFAPSDGKVNVTINPPGYWQEHGKPDHQASLVIDPPDGRTPPLTPEGQAFVKSLRGGLGPGSHFPTKVDSPEDFDDYSRCITRGLGEQHAADPLQLRQPDHAGPWLRGHSQRNDPRNPRHTD